MSKQRNVQSGCQFPLWPRGSSKQKKRLNASTPEQQYCVCFERDFVFNITKPARQHVKTLNLHVKVNKHQIPSNSTSDQLTSDLLVESWKSFREKNISVIQTQVQCRSLCGVEEKLDGNKIWSSHSLSSEETWLFLGNSVTIYFLSWGQDIWLKW